MNYLYHDTDSRLIYKHLPDDIQTEVDNKVKVYRKSEFSRGILGNPHTYPSSLPDFLTLKGAKSFEYAPVWLLKRKLRTFILAKNLDIPNHQDLFELSIEEKQQLVYTNKDKEKLPMAYQELERILEFCPEIDLYKLIDCFLNLLEGERLVWCYKHKQYVYQDMCCKEAECVELYKCSDFWSHYWDLTLDEVDDESIEKIAEDVGEIVDALIQGWLGEKNDSYNWIRWIWNKTVRTNH